MARLRSIGGTKNGPPSLKDRVSAEEWRLRCELAAAHRLIAHFVSVDMTYNHISVRLPENSRHFLVKPDNQFMEQVTASSLVKYDVDGNQVFPRLPAPMAEALKAEGFLFYDRGADDQGRRKTRLVTAFNTPEDDVDAFLATATMAAV